MYLTCRNYLITKVRAVLGNGMIHTARKTMEDSADAHLGAVLSVSDSYTKNGSSKVYGDPGARRRLRRSYDRQATFMVVLGDFTQTGCEAMYEAFLAGLDDQIKIADLPVPITVTEADWVDKDDSKLRSALAVQALIRFDGGVFKASVFAPVSAVEVETERG